MPICAQEETEAVDPQAEKAVRNPEEILEAESSDCQQQRRSACRRLQLDKSPLPQQYSRNLRSSSVNGKERSKKTKSAAQIHLQMEDRVEQPPSKKARGKRISESPNKAIRQASDSETGLFFIHQCEAVQHDESISNSHFIACRTGTTESKEQAEEELGDS